MKKLEDQETEISNAIIEDASIGFSRGMFLDSWLTLDYGGSHQCFGGYVLGGFSDSGKCPAAEHGKHPNLAAEWIVRILRAADVENWSELKGKCIRVKRVAGWNGLIIGIGHITRDDRWFCPETRFCDLIKEQENLQKGVVK